MCCINVSQPTPAVNSMVSLLLATIFLIDITYIVSCNLRENKILNLFGGLLAIDSWYLISLTKNVTETEWLFLLLSPIIILISIKFCFLFLFHDAVSLCNTGCPGTHSVGQARKEFQEDWLYFSFIMHFN